MTRGHKKLDTWEKPLRIRILEILENHGGRITERELISKLKQTYVDVPIKKVYAELMHLEINGLIYVDSTVPANKVIELLREKKVWFRAMGATE